MTARVFTTLREFIALEMVQGGTGGVLKKKV
jgi:hypothetical protein